MQQSFHPWARRPRRCYGGSGHGRKPQQPLEEEEEEEEEEEVMGVVGVGEEEEEGEGEGEEACFHQF